MLSKLLRQFLFILVHLIINVLVAFQNICHQLRIKKRKIIFEEVTKSDIKMILDLTSKMKKSLKHLVLLADTDHHSITDLANVVIWSLITGVSFVSLHDLTGELKENEENLFLAIEKKKKGIPGCIKWKNKPDLNGYTNGKTSNTLIVNVFSSADGRPRIAYCIKQMSSKLLCEKECTEFTAQEFGQILTQIYPIIPDPDLFLYTGPLCCSYGFLPWQIRLSEFIQLSLDHSVNISCYIRAIYKYNKCDQRFGK